MSTSNGTGVEGKRTGDEDGVKHILHFAAVYAEIMAHYQSCVINAQVSVGLFLLFSIHSLSSPAPPPASGHNSVVHQQWPTALHFWSV